MSVRADFYLKQKGVWYWIGSIAHDGDPENLNKNILFSENKKDFIDNITEEIKKRDDGHNSKWVWSENSSRFTDYCYIWKNNKIHIAHLGRGWVERDLYLYSDKIEWDTLDLIEFPVDMKNLSVNFNILNHSFL